MADSHTGRYLAKLLRARSRPPRGSRTPARTSRKR
jgi:hypothetical protein